MPTFSVLLGRRTMQVKDVDKSVVRVGRAEEMDIIIDNPSVSRKHAEFREEGGEWVVEDLDSSNGTFMGKERIKEPRPVELGTEIGMGKFTIVFGKVAGEGAGAQAPTNPHTSLGSLSGAGGTTQIKSSEVKELLKDSERKRKAHIEWRSGGRSGTHYLSEAPAVLFGTDDLCDVQVPKAPRHHVLVINHQGKTEIRNLSRWSKMRVGGTAKKRHVFNSGDRVEIKGLELTFVKDMA